MTQKEEVLTLVQVYCRIDRSGNEEAILIHRSEHGKEIARRTVHSFGGIPAEIRNLLLTAPNK